VENIDERTCQVWCSSSYSLEDLGTQKRDGQADRQTDMAISIWLLMLIKNIYTLWGLPRLFLPIAYFFFNKLIMLHRAY